MPLGGDFTPMKHNQNPLFIYSGNGSVLVDGGSFRAMYTGPVDGQNITFWVYPLGEGEVNFKFDWYSISFMCGGTWNDYGGGGDTVERSEQFSAPANEWTEVSIDLALEVYDLHWNISVDAEGGEPTSFYLDEMSFSGPDS